MMQRYAEYKDSGGDWRGEIPKSWGIAKLKFIASLYSGDSLNEGQKKSYESDDTTVGYAYISSKDITAATSTIDYNNGLRIPKEDYKFKLTPKTASLICIEGGSAGRKIAFTRESVCFVNKLACVAVKQCHDPKYTFYLLKSGPFQKQFFSAMTGLIGGVAISNIKNFELILPPTPRTNRHCQFP
jgi:type I restriction enzyme S subunit